MPMDSPAVSRIFQRLFAHDTCPMLRTNCLVGSRGRTARQYTARRSYRADAKKKEDGHVWQQRTAFYPEDKTKEFLQYQMVTAKQLREWRRRPRRVKMLLRDFIDDSLYNPHYGYFAKQAVIFTPGERFHFEQLKDEDEFGELLGKRYTEFEDALDAKQKSDTRQLWHTPTELFKPYYGEAIARYLITNYKLSLYPYHDLLIYEMGAGNGTLMLNVLDYIHETEPEVYARTKFRVIEISSSLAALQSHQLTRTAVERGHVDKVDIINKSIFDWKTYVSSPCFFVALEVFDNFAHDAIRYDHDTDEPLQCSVLIDDRGDFYEFYERNLDSVAERYLALRREACKFPFKYPLSAPRFWRRLKSVLPGAGNLSVPEYLPTRLMQFFDVLNNYFPEHRLLTSDFHALPDTVEGFNAPVVQTRFHRMSIPVSTPLVQQGYFDILFPTDFRIMEDIYRALTGKLTRVASQEAFLKRWAYTEETMLRSGENPLLSWYKNASVMMTVN